MVADLSDSGYRGIWPENYPRKRMLELLPRLLEKVLILPCPLKNGRHTVEELFDRVFQLRETRH